MPSSSFLMLKAGPHRLIRAGVGWNPGGTSPKSSDTLGRGLRAWPRPLARGAGLLLAVLPIATGEVWPAVRPLLDDYQATPQSIVFGIPLVGDFDNDGLQDVVIVPQRNAPGPVQFLRGRGDGTFDPARDAAFTQPDPRGYGAAADINSDGILDLILNPGVFPDELGEVGTALGNGDGTFRLVVEMTSVGSGYPPAVGDFDGDHRIDFAVVGGRFHDTLSVYYGRGDGSFEAAPFLFLAASNLSGGFAADLDDDGRDDLIFGQFLLSSTLIVRGRVDRQLEPAETLIASGYPLAADDLDSDGDVDLVIRNLPNLIQVAWNSGGGNLLPGEPAPTPYPPGRLTAADLDGDGLKELLLDAPVSGSTFDSYLILRVEPGQPPVVQQQVRGGGGGVWLQAADLDGNGSPDVVSISKVTGLTQVQPGRGDGTVLSQTDQPAGADPTALAGGDLDGDGLSDFVVTNPASRTVRVFKGSAGGGLAAGIMATLGQAPNRITLADLDADGHLDLLVACTGTTANQFRGNVSWLRGHGDGTFDPEAVLGTPLSARDVLVADVDADGDRDVLTTSAEYVVLLRHASDGSFQPAEFIAGGGGTPSALAAADFDHDGALDLALAAFGNPPGFRVLRGLGDGTFVLNQVSTFGIAPTDLALGDFDADGNLDVAVVDRFDVPPGSSGVRRGGGLRVFFGLGDATFPTAAGDSTFEYVEPRAVAAADLNADGRDDIAVVDRRNALKVMANDGDRVFHDVDYYGTESGPVDLLPSDVDHDGRIDLLLANQTSGRISTLLNRGPRPDEDGDGTLNASDPCTDTDGDGVGDPGYPANTCAVDNCPAIHNVAQENGDEDAFGDACDPCPVDSLNDWDGDGHCGAQDRCPDAADPLEFDQDYDGVPDACDNCRRTSNTDQADSNHDGFGDACQATVRIRSIEPDAAGTTIVVSLQASDPQGADLSAQYSLRGAPKPLFVGNLLRQDFTCAAIASLGGAPGTGLIYAIDPMLGVVAQLVDGDSAMAIAFQLVCGDGLIDYYFGFGDCSDPATQVYGDFLELRFLRPGDSICIRSSPYGYTWDLQLDEVGYGDAGLSGLLSSARPLSWNPFDLANPEPIQLFPSASDEVFQLRVSVFNGETAPVVDFGEFVHQGETTLVFRVTAPPHAAIAAAPGTECSGPDGALVDLDGSGSTDPDSTPGTQDDIASYDWYEDYGGAGERSLGSGAVLQTTLGLGSHAVTVKVTDQAGENSTVTTTVAVVDTAPPVIDCAAAAQAAECSGAGGAYVTVSATAYDLCGGTVTLTNDHTSGGADASGSYPLGGTSVVFSAHDGRGHSATCATAVSVVDTQPPSLSLYTDPGTLWPPNHAMVPVSVQFATQDLCGAGVRVELVSVVSSEPDDAQGGDDGQTTGDIQNAEIGTADASIDLRAERAGKSSGRTYMLTYRAIDLSGHATDAVGVVTVPHDQGQGPEPVLSRLEQPGPGGEVRLYWPSVSNATSYDLIRGDLALLRAENGVLHLGTVAVLARGTTATSAIEPATPEGATPPVGGGWFYLIQQVTDRGAVGYGTESAPWPRVPDACGGGCPGAPGTIATTPTGSGSGGTGVRKR